MVNYFTAKDFLLGLGRVMGDIQMGRHVFHMISHGLITVITTE